MPFRTLISLRSIEGRRVRGPRSSATLDRDVREFVDRREALPDGLRARWAREADDRGVRFRRAARSLVRPWRWDLDHGDSGRRLLRRSAYPEHRSAVFAAQFALSHARWLLTYPVSGWVARGREAYTSLALAGISVAAVVTTLILWPREGCRGRARPSRAQLRPPASARDSGRRADIRPRASDRH